MITFDEALAKLSDLCPKRPTQTVHIDNALGARLAAPVMAKISRPPANVSAMDGYAVRLADVRQANTKLSMIGAAPAGTPFDQTLGQGQTVRIFTGGELPDGADHIIPQEDTLTNGNTITIIPASDRIRSVRLKGLDFEEGDKILDQGARLGPAELAITAAANCDELPVYKRPVIALLANGDELKPAGTQLKRGEIISSNPTALGALIRLWGGDPINLGIAGDTVESIQSYIAKAKTADIIVPIGGASVGDHDHMFTAFEQLGFTSVFRKVAAKPGKPTWCSVKDGQSVLGLPGNPASALVCAHLFLKPLVTGVPAHSFANAQLTEPLPKSGPRAEFLRSRAAINASGQLLVSPLSDQDSSLLHPFLEANVLLYRPANTREANIGDSVPVLPIGPLIP